MDYIEAIKKIRQDLAQERAQHDQIAADRTMLQREQLSRSQVNINANCRGCIEGNEQLHSCMLKLMTSPSNHAMNTSMISNKSRAKSKADQMIQNRNQKESGADLNFYRKISKYDLDRLSVNWNKLRKDKKS